MSGIDHPIRKWLLASVACVLTACGSVRPTTPPDTLACGLQEFVVTDVFSDWGTYRRQQVAPLALDAPQPSFNVLALSAGGQFGAYGAGFLTGWGSVGPNARPSARSDIQVVTGVSTGAILATHAFLEMDEEIEARYRRLSGSDIYKRRHPLALLTANSLLDDAGKERLIAENLPGAVIDRVASAPVGRFLYLGVVDLDSGQFLRIDMVKLAKTVKPREARDACYRAVVSASSAIPIAFPPKFIDDRMLTDGGARRHLFLTEPPAEAQKPGVERRLFSLVHGDLDVGCKKIENGLIPVAERSAELFSDQSFKDSIRLGDHLARQPVAPGRAEALFKTFYASAAQAARQCEAALEPCGQAGGTLDEDLFCRPFMECLADQGRADGKAYGRGERPWLALVDLNLSSDPGCSTSKVHRRVGQ